MTAAMSVPAIRRSARRYERSLAAQGRAKVAAREKCAAKRAARMVEDFGPEMALAREMYFDFKLELDISLGYGE